MNWVNAWANWLLSIFSGLGEAFNLALVGYEPPPKNQKAYEVLRLNLSSSVKYYKYVLTFSISGTNESPIWGAKVRIIFNDSRDDVIKLTNENGETDFYFDKEAIALLMAIRFKQGVPTQSKTSFATLTGVKSVAI